MISYAITVADEVAEVEALLRVVCGTIRSAGLDAEVVVLIDSSNHPPDLPAVIDRASEGFPVRTAYHALADDFAAHKNHLTDLCRGSFVFQLDADERPSPDLMLRSPHLLAAYPQIDGVRIPRLNRVAGLTPDDIARWGWVVTPDGWVNWPDYQPRLYRNTPTIRWHGRVHETLVGVRGRPIRWVTLKPDERVAILHDKTIDRQRLQNARYARLERPGG